MLDREVLVDTGRRTDEQVEELPLRVVPDWEEQVKRGSEVCRLIDRHLDYEARGRLLLDLDDFRPQHLCPEQRVQMLSDLFAVTR
ncbi:MAG: hypothetical protein ACK47B_02275 [Armatimonadota bacterium]